MSEVRKRHVIKNAQPEFRRSAALEVMGGADEKEQQEFQTQVKKMCEEDRDLANLLTDGLCDVVAVSREENGEVDVVVERRDKARGARG